MFGRKIMYMHRQFGKDSTHRCGDCPNLRISKWGRKTRYKCAAYGVTLSAATDWAKRWTACGLYGEPLAADHVPLIKRLTRTKQQEKPIDGQMTFLETEEESQ